MQRSDDKSATRGPLPDRAHGVGTPADKLPVSSLRDRIRVSSAAARVSELPSPPPAAGTTRGSVAPPEHSGVLSRPAAEARTGRTEPPGRTLFTPPLPAASALRPPPLPREQRAPRAPGAEPLRHSATQVGLGAVQPSAAASTPNAPSTAGSVKVSNVVSTRGSTPPTASSSAQLDAAAPAVSSDITTARTQRLPRVTTKTASVAPTAANAFEPASSSPTLARAAASKPPIPGLLRAAQRAPGEGRYSIQDVSAEYVETRRRSVPPPVPKDFDLPPTPAVASTPGIDADDPLARSRRATPKERPGRRKNTTVSQPPPLPASNAQASRSAPSVPVTAPAKVEARKEAPSSAATAPAVDDSRSEEALPAALGSPASEPAATVVPETEARGATAARVVAEAPVAAAHAETYEPLPADRASYEAYVQSLTKDPTFSRLRPDWTEKETILIARDTLEERAGSRAGRLGGGRGVVLLVLSLAAIGVGLAWIRSPRQSDDLEMLGSDELASAAHGSVSTRSAAAGPMTLLATEPSGAEIVLGGAVVGNTPAEVPRPTSEQLYLLRLPGFEPQLVRLSPESRDAIRITLAPIGRTPQTTGAEPLPVAP